MSDAQHRIFVMLERDPRFKLDAYQFVRDALSYAQEERRPRRAASSRRKPEEKHLTGQQLCDAIRRLALEQYGYMAKVVLNSWGVYSTSDFGDIVYNLIDIGLMNKSEEDRREHFDNVYDFDEAFMESFRITMPE